MYAAKTAPKTPMRGPQVMLYLQSKYSTSLTSKDVNNKDIIKTLGT